MSHLSSKKTLLVVDDETDILEILQEFFSDAFQVRIASSVDAALELFKKVPIDCILTDIKMPGKDGFELIRCVQAQNSKLPIIAMTGHATQEDIDKVLSAGIKARVEKPFDLAKLQALIEKSVRGS